MDAYDIEILIPVTFKVETDDIDKTIRRLIRDINNEADVTFSGQVMVNEEDRVEVRDIIMHDCEFTGYKKR